MDSDNVYHITEYDHDTIYWLLQNLAQAGYDTKWKQVELLGKAILVLDTLKEFTQ